MIAVALLESLAPYRPIVVDGELVIELDTPPGLLARLGIFHTGVRGVLSGRKWEADSASVI